MKALNNLVFACIALYLLWCGLNLLLPGRAVITDALLWKWTLLTAVFLTVYLLPRKEWVLWVLAAVGGAQAYYAIGQQIGYIASNHSLFSVTGFMGNPGQLGGFQAVALLSTAALTAKVQSCKLRLFVLWPLLLLLAYSLVLSDSRAGWWASGVGGAVLFWAEICRLFRSRRWLLVPILLAVIVSAAALYNYRSDSAKGRLLIWRVSADMVADKPLAGYGAGGFNQHYMLYQACYFEQHPDSQFLMVADNAAYPYNEFLHVLVEQGIVGLLLFFVVIVAAFATTSDNRILAPLAGLLAFSLFSYPSYKLGLLVLFPVLLGCVGKGLPCVSRRWRCVLLSITLIFATIAITRHIWFYGRMKAHAGTLMRGYDPMAADFMSAHFDLIYPNLRYNSLYMYWMFKYPEIWDESKLPRIFPSCENYCDIGDYYAGQGRYDQAECYYHTASQMIPTRILPNYRLWRLNLTQGRSEQAKRMAERILSQPLKVENTFTLRVKEEIRRWYAQ